MPVAHHLGLARRHVLRLGRIEGAVQHGFAMEHGEGRLQFRLEPFVLIVADQHDDIGRGRGKPLGQAIELILAARMALAAYLDPVQRREIVALPQRHELVERIGLAAIGMEVDPIGRRAEIPMLRRARQQRPVRRTEAEENLRHPALLALARRGLFVL
jgi:hypothetical protein